MTHRPKLVIIGLDCAEPSLAFDRWHGDLPNLAGLMARGHFGRLESSFPAITVPAWSCMMSGRDPGELGIYGFRNRVDRGYGRMGVADARAVHVPRLWDYLGQAGWKVAVVGVPGTYPPPEVNGSLVSCFLTPDTSVTYTHPPALGTQIKDWVGDYLLDVPNFRSTDKARIVRDIYILCDQRFSVATHLLKEQEPDFLMLVDMGVDRIHHALWKAMDPAHPLHVPGDPFADAIHQYYQHVDQHIGQLVAQLGDETVVLVVSDHGGRPLMGGVAINDWLIEEGYLTLASLPEDPQPLDKLMDRIDWSTTRAWGAGGYYGRIFLNVRGREPHGAISPAHYEQEREELAERLRAMVGPDGQPLGNRVFTPQGLYQTVRGIAPDLIVYFGDLAWRAIGVVGGGERFPVENDTGPDDANHAQHGLVVIADPAHPGQGQLLEGAQIYDILPTLLTRFGLSAPADLRGKPLPLN